MQGLVVSRDGDTAWVTVERSSACYGCAHAGRCVGNERAAHTFCVDGRPDLVPGMTVEVEFPERRGLGLALWAYGLPVVLLIAGIAGGATLAAPLGLDPDVAGLVAGGFCLALGLVFLHVRDRRVRLTFNREVAVRPASCNNAADPCGSGIQP